MTLQYDLSTEQLIYGGCQSGTDIGLWAECCNCIPGQDTCSTCNTTYTATITGATKSYVNGVYTVTQIVSASYCHWGLWERYITDPDDPARTMDRSLDLSFNEYTNCKWRFSFDLDRFGFFNDWAGQWEKDRFTNCDMTGAYTWVSGTEEATVVIS